VTVDILPRGELAQVPIADNKRPGALFRERHREAVRNREKSALGAISKRVRNAGFTLVFMTDRSGSIGNGLNVRDSGTDELQAGRLGSSANSRGKAGFTSYNVGQRLASRQSADP